jgi:hypothetical protein
MNEAAFTEAVFILNPRTAERAKRLACAVRLLREGLSVAEVRTQIRLRYKVAGPVAWRVVDMAADMAGEQTTC